MMIRSDQIYGNGSIAPRKIISNCFNDREEELSFFRDLQKHEKNQAVASLLQPVSEEYEANGNYGLYIMRSGGRKGQAAIFLPESGKHDYNWLKTPPATPLFPSLEMEVNPQELVVHRDLPIVQPLTRFAGTSALKKTINQRPTSPSPKHKLPSRHKLPTGKQPITSSTDKKNMKAAPLISIQTNQSAHKTRHDSMKPQITTVVRSSFHNIERKSNFLASNHSKSIETKPALKTKLKSTGVSHSLRANLKFSDETPPNLKTTINRPDSATRGRPTNHSLTLLQKEDTHSKTRRQSCSPSVSRGRKTDMNASDAKITKAQQVSGSRMLDRFMNARTSNVEAKTKLGNSVSDKSSRISNEGRRAKIYVNS